MEEFLDRKYSGYFLKDIGIYSSLVCEDNGRKLYELDETFYDTSIEAFQKRKPSLEISESTWRQIDTISSNALKLNVNLPITVQGVRGRFDFTSTSANNRNIMRVKLIKSKEGVEPVIQFGFSKVQGLSIEDGDLVSLIAETRIVSDKKRTASIFIQDKTDKWSRKKIYLKAGQWQENLVVYKIRNGVKRMSLGIYWEPVSDEEYLEIASARIYVKKRENNRSADCADFTD
jgi:hypothetical protein